MNKKDKMLANQANEIKQLQRNILDKLSINKILDQKNTNISYEYQKFRELSQALYDENEKDIQNLKDIIELQIQENEKLKTENENLEELYDIQKKLKAEITNKNSELKRT